ncbi:MAG: hypothetical protein HF967_09005 [Methanosarcinales archaeon]|nr:hypothetical protein [Methanosarcinales archaeon]
MTEEYKNYSNHVYDLSIKRTDVPIDIEGGNINVIAATGDCYLKLNEKSQDPVNLLHVNSVKGKFKKFYISNNIQVGNYVAFIVSRPDLEFSTNITRDAFTPITLPCQNIPQHLIERVIKRPPLINTWDIRNATLRHTFIDPNQNILLQGISFNNDGSKFYISGRIQVPPANVWTGKVFEYDLGIPWDISTAAFRHSFNVNAQVPSPIDVSFNNDGTLLFILNNETNRIIKYTLSRKWDVSSATYTSTNTPPITGVFSYQFSPLGNKLYLGDFHNNLIKEYDLSVPWDITTATLKGSLNVGQFIEWPINIFISPEGLAIFVMDFIHSKMVGYRLLTAWDITTAILRHSFNFRPILTGLRDKYFRPDGKKLYIGSHSDNKTYEFDL